MTSIARTYCRGTAGYNWFTKSVAIKCSSWGWAPQTPGAAAARRAAVWTRTSDVIDWKASRVAGISLPDREADSGPWRHPADGQATHRGIVGPPARRKTAQRDSPVNSGASACILRANFHARPPSQRSIRCLRIANELRDQHIKCKYQRTVR